MYGIKIIKQNVGFTLIELLVVISIIGLLASVVLVSLNTARAKSRDAKRLTDMGQAVKAISIYYDTNQHYPNSDYQGCGGWDTPGDGDFIQALNTAGIISTNIKDPTTNDNCSNYRYYVYTAGSYGCDATRGNYFVLGVVNMETSGNPHPQSKGWSCSGRNWQNEMEWVIGGFER
jgi:prepilin-type N-terminal cleavage/methylation domain-containing protein